MVLHIVQQKVRWNSNQYTALRQWEDFKTYYNSLNFSATELSSVIACSYSRRTIFADCFLANVAELRGLILLQNSSWLFVMSEASAQIIYSSLNFSATELASVIVSSYSRWTIFSDCFLANMAELRGLILLQNSSWLFVIKWSIGTN